MENKWTVNRIICAASGPLGKFLANLTDKALTAAGYERKIVETGRKVAGHGGAFILTAMGAPEAALAVASSAGAADTNAGPEPKAGEGAKAKTINADVTG